MPNADCRVGRTGSEVHIVWAPSHIRYRYNSTLSNIKLTSAVVTFPSFESFPVFHNIGLLFIFFCGHILKGLLGFLVGVCLSIAAIETRLEGTLRGEASVLPQQDGALVICAREQTTQVVPPDTVDGTVVSRQYGEQSLGLGSFILEQTLH